MKKFYSLSIFLALFFSVLLVGNLEAATYYIDGSNGSDSNPGTLTLSWKTISKANSTLTAGDIVYIRAGTYREQIRPNKSGSLGKYITYQRYPGDPKYSVIISTSSHGANLSNKNYITLDGLYFNNCGARWILMEDSDYNIIQNCKFYDAEAFTGIKVYEGASYNQFLNNIFEDAALYSYGVYWDQDCQDAWDAQTALKSACDRGTAPSDTIGIFSGWGNKIEGNTFGKCAHQAITAYTYYLDGEIDRAGGKLIVRGNTFSNGYHTNISILKGHYALIENNIVKNAGEHKISNPKQRDRVIINGAGIYVMAEPSIIRKNKVYNNDYGYYYGGIASSLSVSNHQKAYNNTFYNNTWQVLHGNDNKADKEYNNNILKNNIFYDDGNISIHTLHGSIADKIGNNTFRDWVNYGDAGDIKNYIINNLFTVSTDRIFFKNTSSTIRMLAQVKSLYPSEWHSSNFGAEPLFIDAKNHDFALQSNSPSINVGAWLTTITSSTASGVSSFVVDDSRYFYDGWGIPGETGDIIKTQNGAVTTIKGINYDTHTITVSPAISIVEGEGLALNYSGSAPDIGAYEYGETTDMVSPPSGLVIRTSQN